MSHNSYNRLELIPAFIYVVVMMIISILGNGITCFIFGYKLRQTVFRNFIFTLALLDLISSIICMPAEIYFLATITAFNHPELCKLFRYITYVSHSSTSLILLAIAWDRYYKVCRPLQLFFDIRKCRLFCVVSIVISFGLSLPSLFLYGTKTLPLSNYSTCSVDDSMEQSFWPFIFYIAYLLGFAFIAVAMVILYAFVIKAVKTLKTRQEFGRGQEFRRGQEAVSLINHKVTQDKVMGNEIENKAIEHSTETDTNKEDDQDKCKPETKYDSGITEETKQTDKPKESSFGAIPEIHIENTDPETSEILETCEVATTYINKRCLVIQRDEIHSSFVSELTSDNERLTDSDHEGNDEIEVKRNSTIRRDLSTKKEPIPHIQLQFNQHKSAYKPGKTIRMLIAVTLCFVLSFLPFFIVVIIRSLMKSDLYMSMNTTQSIVSHILVRSYLVSNAVNPIIYGICNRQFRKEVKRFLQVKCFRLKSRRRIITGDD